MKTYLDLTISQKLIYTSILDKLINKHPGWNRTDFMIAIGTLLNMLKRGNMK